MATSSTLESTTLMAAVKLPLPSPSPSLSATRTLSETSITGSEPDSAFWRWRRSIDSSAALISWSNARRWLSLWRLPDALFKLPRKALR
jgi:hypothetical protein